MSNFTNGTKKSHYIFDKVVGKGSFGKVYMARDRHSGARVAIKVVELDGQDVSEMLAEISTLSALRSSYITKLISCFVERASLYLVMEYCGGGSCLDIVRAAGPFDEDAIAIVMNDVLRGLEFLQLEKRLHRDIKGANILITDDGYVKIADLGVSSQLSWTVTHNRSTIGTPHWMAPEVIEAKPYDYKADIWSLGITAYELAEGSVPLSNLEATQVLQMIVRAPAPVLKRQSIKWPDRIHSLALCEFVALCLEKVPTCRPSARELLMTEFIRGRPRCRTSLVRHIFAARRRQAARRCTKENKPRPMNHKVGNKV